MMILIDGRSLSLKHTGISRYTENLILGYEKKYGKSNVKVIANNGDFSSRYNIVYTQLQPYNLFHFIQFSFFLKRIDYDIFHSPFYSSSFFKSKGKIHILTVHDLMYRIVPNFFTTNFFINRFSVIYYNLLIRRSISNSNWIISVSNTTQNDLKRCFSANSTVFSEGVNFILGSNDSSILSNNELTKNNYFLYVGNSRPHKNLSFLIDSFASSKTKKKLVVCGTNQRFFSNSANVITLGFVSEEDLYHLYVNCAAFVFPSLYEGFGLPILESLNLGAKVFCSNIGALSEFSELCVSFFNPVEKRSLIKLIENVDTIKLDKDLVKHELEKYNWDNIMSNFQNCLSLKIIQNKW